VRISDSTISGNRGLLATSGLILRSLVIERSYITDNIATFWGAGIIMSGLDYPPSSRQYINITNSVFARNVVFDDVTGMNVTADMIRGGAALVVEGPCTSIITSSSFDSNQVVFTGPKAPNPTVYMRGGAIMFGYNSASSVANLGAAPALLSVKSSTFRNNSAIGQGPSGGAVATLDGSVAVFDDCLFVNNSAVADSVLEYSFGGGFSTFVRHPAFFLRFFSTVFFFFFFCFFFLFFFW
jgi:hypothetical protein